MRFSSEASANANRNTHFLYPKFSSLALISKLRMNKKQILALCAFFSLTLPANAVKVVFRLDDPTVQYDSVHSRVLQLFAGKGIPLSVATIPCAKEEIPHEINDSSYWQLLNAPTIEIALHGLTHEDINRQGEFGGLSSDETCRRFRKGKHILSEHFDKPINTFIPPFNATNASFPENLESNGLHLLSADMFQRVPRKGDIQYYPETLGHLMKQKGIWNAANESILKCRGKNAICVVMFHAYDLPDSTAWLQLENLLEACNNNKKVELHTFSSLYDSGEHSDWLRYRANQLSGGLSKYLLHKGVLHPTWLCLAIHIINTLAYMLIALVGMIVLLVRTHSISLKRIVYLALVVIGAVIFCIAWFHILSPLKLLLLAVLSNTIPLIYMVVRR